jgi:murein L,D-transpeptidase YcbB/YkuD
VSRAFIVLVLSIAVSPACAGLRLGQAGADAGQADLEKLLATKGRPDFVTADREGTRLWKLTRDFYSRRGNEMAWVEDKHPRPQMDAFIKALAGADAEGLDPETYSYSALAAQRKEAGKGFLTKQGFEPAQAARLDAWMTYLYMKYSSDLADGVSDLAHADRTWQIEPEAFDPLQHLEHALSSNDIEESLRSLLPNAPQYTHLRESLTAYRKIAAAGGWPQIAPRARFKAGQTSEHVTMLAARLKASGDFKGAVSTDPMPFSADLVEAVKHFQSRHGLEPDGVPGPAVIAAMNVPVETRIDQIRLNLERWRWLPRDLGARHILVNIPQYHLEVWENGAPALTMRVVVGRKDTQTPIFNDRMTYIVFSPYWNVPPGIAQNETLPAIMSDAAFLKRNNMEVLDRSGQVVDPATIDLSDPERYRFRQRPGGANSLGLVKFMFPNQFNVYLHDTPADSLFARASRSFSHGCVRVEDPQALARYLLRDQPEWTEAKIAEAMHAGEEQHVKLREAIPVYLGYWTTSAGPEGVQFRSDVYGIDRRQAALVAERTARMKKVALAPLAPAASGARTKGSGM